MDLHVYQLAMATRFRGITQREGVLVRGEGGWGEFSPFLDYSGDELVAWRTAALEAAQGDWPEPLRTSIPVNVTVPAVDAERAHQIVSSSGCRTAKVKVAEPGQTPADDIARVEAVRDALGPEGHVRVDANGGWDLDEALTALRRLDRYDLEYAEQPVAATEDLARLRLGLAIRGIQVPVAADESIRRSGDPERVKKLDAADVAVLKVQPLGGVRRCLELAEMLDMPVVVSSALETSVGIAMGLRLASLLPELPYACGLNTVRLLHNDVVREPLIAVDGALPVRDVTPDDNLLAAAAAPADRVAAWQQRWDGAAR